MKLRFKFIYLYIFCVFIPVIVVDCVFLSYVYKREKTAQLESLDNLARRIIYEIHSTVDGVEEMANILYTDESIYQFLSRDYDSVAEYYEAYSNFQKNSGMKYVYSIPDISSLELFVDNETIVEGGFYRKIENVSNEEWYQTVKQSENETLLLEEDLEVDGVKLEGPRISVVRMLDYSHNAREIVLKLGLDYYELKENIQKEIQSEEVVIKKGDRILFDTAVGQAGSDAEGNQKKKSVMFTEGFTILNEEWQMQIRSNQIPVWYTIVESKGIILILLLINFVLPTFVMVGIERSIVHRITLLKNQFNRVEQEEFDEVNLKCGKDEIGDLISHFNLMVSKIRLLLEEKKAESEEKRLLEVSKKQAELNALLSQVNPHFMYNTLECICMRSLIKGERETADIVRSLSLLLREMSSWKEDQVTIRKELQFIESYLKIQKYRFDEKISFQILAEPECCELLIPKLTIISFVENACVHGIEGALEPGIVTVTVGGKVNNWYVQVKDTGCGMTQKQLDKVRNKLKNPSIDSLYGEKGTGILNAYIRLRAYFDERMLFTIDSRMDQGTSIIVSVSDNGNRG